MKLIHQNIEKLSCHAFTCNTLQT